MSDARRERSIVALLGAVQFVNILDFMMVMPLGPYLVEHLGIHTNQMGLVAGSYTASAAVAGLVGSWFLDRFDRRPALFVAMLGLVVGTAAGGLATSLTTLVLARVVAGAFGGPATALSLAIVSDKIPQARRGRALASLMTAFSVSSVLGVPCGLFLAAHGGWRAPFFVVAAMGAVIAAAATFALPSAREHLDDPQPQPTYASMLRRSDVRLAAALAASSMMAMFVLIPQISTFMVFNVGYPQARLGLLYMAGGVTSIVVLRAAGALVDRVGAWRIAALGTLLLVPVLYVGFVVASPATPAAALFAVFMASTSLRNVPFNQLQSRVPSPKERARFMSLLSSVQHVSSALAGVLSSRLLSTRADGGLVGMSTVTYVAIGLSLLAPPLMWRIERLLASRGEAEPQPLRL
ncbi:MAG: MFS transporter [Polyangiaceae bacterium]|nr:MFS transporter [Polyangiaceae bacterium]